MQLSFLQLQKSIKITHKYRTKSEILHDLLQCNVGGLLTFLTAVSQILSATQALRTVASNREG